MSEQNKPRRDYMQEVTNEIIAAMEKGNLPWQKPWDPEVGGNLCPKPFNGKSGKAYTVENAIRLLINMGEKNSADPRYFTYVQAKEKDWTIKQGAKAICVRQGFYATKDLAGNDLPEEECHWTNKYINVFHASDICADVEYAKDENGKIIYEDVLDENGKPVMVYDLDKNGKPKNYEIAYDESGRAIIGEDGRYVMQPTQKVKRAAKLINYTPIPEYAPKSTSRYTHEETMELAEAVLQNSGAKFSHISADKAFYEQNSDTIMMPPKEAFPTLEGYYAVALHELAHWTGHESRLNRDMNGDKSSISYAKEELRAELASVFLSMELGVPVNTTQNAAYIQSWIQNLKEDKLEIFKAANDAMKITSYIKGLAKEKLKEITLSKVGKTEEPEIKVVNEAKEEKAQKLPPQEAVAESQNKNKELETPEVKPIPEIVNEPIVQKTIEQPEPQPACLVISVYNPKDGEFGKELDKDSNGKFKLNDFERQPPDIILDTNTPEEYFARHNTHAVGSLVQIDDELFYMNKNNKFNRVYGAFLNGEVVLAFAANPSKFTKQIIDKIGQKEFDNYKQKFIELFRNGAAFENIATDINNLDLAYERFVYDNAFKYGVSSNNPVATKQWDNINKAFMKTCAKEFGADSITMDLAAKAIKDFCPLEVDADALKIATVKSNNYQNKKVQVAAYGAR